MINYSKKLQSIFDSEYPWKSEFCCLVGGSVDNFGGMKKALDSLLISAQSYSLDEGRF